MRLSEYPVRVTVPSQIEDTMNGHAGGTSVHQQLPLKLGEGQIGWIGTRLTGCVQAAPHVAATCSLIGGDEVECSACQV
jgi:hypothetical protein